MKNSAIIYEQFYKGVQVLPPDQKAEAYDAYCELAIYGKPYEGDNLAISVLLSALSGAIEKSNENYQKKVDTMRKNRESKKSCDITRHLQTSQDISESYQKSQETCTDTVTDTVTVTDTDSVTDNEHPTGAEEKEKREARSARSSRPSRHKLGEFGHVLLSDEELKRLNDKHGINETRGAIEAVDKYCEKTGKRYKNYSIVLEDWGYRSAAEKARSGTPKPEKKMSLREKWGIPEDDNW